MFLSPDGKGPRLHVKAREIGNQLFGQFGSLSNLFDKSVENAAAKAAAADEAARRLASSTQNGGKEPPPEKRNFSGMVKGRQCDYPLGGRTTRVDFQIQPGVSMVFSTQHGIELLRLCTHYPLSLI